MRERRRPLTSTVLALDDRFTCLLHTLEGSYTTALDVTLKTFLEDDKVKNLLVSKAAVEPWKIGY